MLVGWLVSNFLVLISVFSQAKNYKQSSSVGCLTLQLGICFFKLNKFAVMCFFLGGLFE